MTVATHSTNARRALITAGKALLVIVVIGVFFTWMGRREETQRAETAMKAGVVPYSFEEIAQVIATERRPVLLFLYASWCPYCRQDVPLIEQAAKTHGERIRILPVSIDGEPGKLGDYIRAEGLTFTPYNIAGSKERALLDSQFEGYGLRYRGHIPYLAAFKGGRPILELNGVLEKDIFAGMLADIENAGDAPHKE